MTLANLLVVISQREMRDRSTKKPCRDVHRSLSLNSQNQKQPRYLMILLIHRTAKLNVKIMLSKEARWKKNKKRHMCMCIMCMTPPTSNPKISKTNPW